MQIEIIAFGIAKDILGGNSISYEIESPATVAQLLASLKADYPGFSRLASLGVAVNSEYARQDHIIHASDEVVLIPPVSGG